MNISIETKDWSTCLENDVPTLRCIPIVVQNLANALIVFSGIVAVFFIIYGGYKYLTSQGDPAKLDSARKTLIYAVIGLVIVAFSFYILSIISNLTGVTQLPH